MKLAWLKPAWMKPAAVDVHTRDDQHDLATKYDDMTRGGPSDAWTASDYPDSTLTDLGSLLALRVR